MNEITIVGNVTADPVLRKSANGRGVVRFDVAINRRRFNRETNQYDDLPPVFHRVVAFGPVAENAAETLRKGLEVVVVGQMADDSYEYDAVLYCADRYEAPWDPLRSKVVTGDIDWEVDGVLREVCGGMGLSLTEIPRGLEVADRVKWVAPAIDHLLDEEIKRASARIAQSTNALQQSE